MSYMFLKHFETLIFKKTIGSLSVQVQSFVFLHRRFESHRLGAVQDVEQVIWGMPGDQTDQTDQTGPLIL